MNTQQLEERLLVFVEEHVSGDDVSHDVRHLRRVLGLAKRIAQDTGADLEIVIPAALFHDIIVYPKHDPRSQNETEESAEFVGKVLQTMPEYPREKITAVQTAIRQCSFSKGIVPNLLEAKVLQDADRLEATGAIAIMRTFASTGQWKRPFFDEQDPFCEHREPDAKAYALDLFYVRLLVVESRMHTRLGKTIAKRRTEFLRAFLDELRTEIDESSDLSRTNTEPNHVE